MSLATTKKKPTTSPKRKRIPTDHDFRRMVLGKRKLSHRLVDRFAGDKISAEQFGDAFSAILEDAHTRAIVLGRQRGGDLAYEDADDRALARSIIDEEHERFVRGFVKDLQSDHYVGDDGKLKVDSIRYRCDLYMHKVRSSANLAFTLQADEDTEFALHTVKEDNCDDCIEGEKNSPYLRDDLPYHPADGTTKCRTECGCILVMLRADGSGLLGFAAVPF